MESPPTKKRKTAPAGSDQGAKGGGGTKTTKGREVLQLPATVWASVLHYLAITDAMRALLISRGVAFDAANELTLLHVSHPTELDARLSKRFPGVQEIHVHCLVRNSSDGEGVILCADTAERLVYFLTSFQNLSWVRVIPPAPRYRSYDYKRCQGPANHAEVYKELLSSLCNAFKAKSLRTSLGISGIIGEWMTAAPVDRTHRCDVHDSVEAPCRLCRRICSYLPLYNVITLPCKMPTIKFSDGLCVNSTTMSAILKGRKWEESDLDHAYDAYYILLRLQIICLQNIVDAGVIDSEVANAFETNVRAKGGDPSDCIHFILDEQIDRIETLLEIERIHDGLTREDQTLWSREELMEAMNDSNPNGGYML